MPVAAPEKPAAVVVGTSKKPTGETYFYATTNELFHGYCYGFGETEQKARADLAKTLQAWQETAKR